MGGCQKPVEMLKRTSSNIPLPVGKTTHQTREYKNGLDESPPNERHHNHDTWNYH